MISLIINKHARYLMTKKSANARPAVLTKPMTPDLRSFARTNVGSFLNDYKMRNGKLLGPT